MTRKSTKVAGSLGKKVSPEQAEKLRQVGRLSRGPITPAGKLASSKNSLRHGLRAENIVLPTESAEAFEAHRAAIIASLEPRAYLESWFAERIALETWRLDRAARVERATVSSQMRIDEARCEAGEEQDRKCGFVTSREHGGEKYRLVVLEVIANLEKKMESFLKHSESGSKGNLFDASEMETLYVACSLSPEEIEEASNESAEDVFEYIAETLENRLGKPFSVQQMFAHAIEILRGSANDVRSDLTGFDRDVLACLERKALPRMDRLDLLLRYENAASRSLSRLLTEYRNLRAENPAIEGVATEKTSPQRVAPLRAIEGGMR